MPNINQIITSSKLKQRRNGLGFTHEKVELKTGVSDSYVSLLETGNRGFQLTNKIIKLLKLLKYEIILRDAISGEVYVIDGEKK